MESESVTHNATRLGYRPALDGVRALSILLVLFFHAGVAGFTGGFFGVDIFFVLSGFLITSLLLEERVTSGSVSLLQFWRRRLKRLMPAIAVLVVGVNVVSLFMTPAGLYGHLGADTVSSLFFFANWHFITATSSYFFSLGVASPLNHMWSLAIEEQFYWIWPVALWFALRRRVSATTLIGGVLLVGIASQMWMTHGATNHVNTNRLYFGSDTHLQGLVAGAVAALLFFTWRQDSSKLERASTWLARLAPLALMGLGLSFWLISEKSALLYRGGFAIVAVCAALLVLHLTSAPTALLGRLFALRPLVFVGKISFGLYLWHYPVFVFINRNNLHHARYSLLAIRLAVTFVVTVISYYLIERPLRRGALPSRPWHYVAIAALVGALAISSVQLEHRQNQRVTYSPPASVAPTQTSTLLLGDSVAMTLAVQISPWAPHFGVDLHSGAYLGCGIIGTIRPVTTGHLFRNNPACRLHDGIDPLLGHWQQAIDQYHPKVIVVLSGRWESYNVFMPHGRLENIFGTDMQHRIRNAMRNLNDMATTAGAKVLYLTAPCFNPQQNAFGDTLPESDPKRVDAYNSLITSEAHQLGNDVYDLNARVCPTGKFQWRVAGKLVRQSDGIHFDTGITPLVAPELFARINQLATTR